MANRSGRNEDDGNPFRSPATADVPGERDAMVRHPGCLLQFLVAILAATAACLTFYFTCVGVLSAPIDGFPGVLLMVVAPVSVFFILFYGLLRGFRR